LAQKRYKKIKHKFKKGQKAEKYISEYKERSPTVGKNDLFKSSPILRVYPAIFILSVAVICFEIVLTRISSLVFTYNYAFIIVSLAILGLGCGGIFGYYWWKAKKTTEPGDLYNFLSFNSGLFSIFVAFFIMLITLVSIFSHPFLYFTFSFIPFFFAGAVFSVTFQSFAGASFKLYAADLIGAAMGAALSIWILERLGGPNSVLFISVIGIVASFLLVYSYKVKRLHLKNLRFLSVIAGVIVLIFIFSLIFSFMGDIQIRESDLKDLYLMINSSGSKAEIIESRWSAFGRTDMAGYSDNDLVRFLFIDGAAGTPMFKFDGDLSHASENLDFLNMIFSGTFPFHFLNEDEKNNMLIIGPGGGREIIIGLVNGVDSIVGVEINKDFVDMVKEYSGYNGGIYTDFNNIEIVVDEGRNYVRTIEQKFDIILIIQPFTKSSRSFEGYTLTENYLFTVQSIQDYLNHLTSEGRIIAVLHNNNEIMRFITTTLKAMEQQDIGNMDAMKYFYTVGKDINPVIVLQKTPFSEEEAYKRFEAMISYRLVSPGSFIPYIPQEEAYYLNEKEEIIQTNLFNEDLIALAGGQVELDELIKKSNFNIKPTTDDRPFFFKDEKGIPDNIIPLLIIAFLVNMVIIIISMVNGRRNKGARKLLTLALLLGFGFIIIEVSFFQKLILYMGSPIASLAVILGALLMGMGIGSFVASKILVRDSQKKLIICSLVIFVLTSGIFFGFTPLLNNFLSFKLFIKALISSSFLIPVGFVLGIPFPTAIRIAKETGNSRFITWMYGINGTMAVFGSVIAMALSTAYGFSAALVVGTVCYLIIAIIFLLVRDKTN